MDFQEIRKYYETPVTEVCDDKDVTYRPENTLVPNGDAETEYCVARIQFGEMAEQAVGTCGPRTNKRAVFIVEYYGQKGIGPAKAQNFMSDVMCEIGKLKGIISVNGPDFTALDETPYYFARVSFGLQIPTELD